MASSTISVRYDTDTRALIEAAADRSGRKVSDFVRQIVLNHLEGEGDLDQLRLRMAALESEVQRVDSNLAAATQMVLQAVGTMSDDPSLNPTDIAKWVDENLRRSDAFDR